MRVAFFTDNYSENRATLDPFRVELLKALARRASALLYIQANDFTTGMGDYTEPRYIDLIRDALRDFKPDLIFSLNRAGLTADVLDGVSCPVRSWFIDNPARFPASILRFHPGERVFCATSYMMGWTARHTGPDVEVEYLPFCANDAVFRPGPLPSGAAPCDVSFVGTLWNPAPLLSYIDRHLVRDQDRRWFEERFNRRLRDYEYPFELEMVQRFGGMEVDVLRNAVDDMLSTRRRLDVLEDLADLDLEIYGTRTWAGQCLLRSNSLFRRFSPEVVNSSDGLLGLYRRSRVCLSISHHQAQTGFPIRVFDILATGAPLVTDRRREIGELFEEGTMFLAYDDAAEARECVLRVLRDPAQAARMRDSAVALVRERHTFAHRIESLLSGVTGRPTRSACRFLNASRTFRPEVLRGRGDPALVVATLSWRHKESVATLSWRHKESQVVIPLPPAPSFLRRASQHAKRVANKCFEITAVVFSVLWLLGCFSLMLVLGRTACGRYTGIRSLFHLVNRVGAANLGALREIRQYLRIQMRPTQDHEFRATYPFALFSALRIQMRPVEDQENPAA